MPGDTAGLSGSLWGYEMGWPQIIAIIFMVLGVCANIISHGKTTTYDASRSIIGVAWWATILGLGGFWNFH
jgi:hypothetical protein